MKKYKVCIATIEFPPEHGGVGQSVFRIAKMLESSGYEVHVVVFHTRQLKVVSPNEQTRGLIASEYLGIKVYRVETGYKSNSNPVPEFLSDIAMELKNLHAKQHFDLFHAFFLNETGLISTLVANELGIPIINSIRGADLHKNIFNSKHFHQIIWSLQNSSWVTFVSRELEKRAHVLEASTRQKTSAFWNSIEPWDVNKLASPTYMPELRGTVVSAFGRFRDKKGTDHLIRACEKLSETRDMTLLLVGDFVDKEKPYWLKMINSSPMKDNIIVTGLMSRDEAIRYFPYVDVFAIPSLRDGCPNALLEAMTAGRAIVGTHVDAIGEILEDGVNAFVVPPADVDALANAIERFANDSQLRIRMGLAAQTTAIDKLHPNVERQNWLNVYEKVLNIDASLENADSPLRSMQPAGS